ncbi:hypothetical protein B0T24DRAFT_154812 [Lasiosphaeria ovina]|uniref:Uncharacterized protein n=1 Tax=Lasiosphaeria ovina TaxID=92902 RepID=A0AAE0NDK8_9PEZI|nr:hypothetical protein B0T24DRAFT_154812 [Lasiosphaeria ovina]
MRLFAPESALRSCPLSTERALCSAELPLWLAQGVPDQRPLGHLRTLVLSVWGTPAESAPHALVLDLQLGAGTSTFDLSAAVTIPDAPTKAAWGSVRHAPTPGKLITPRSGSYNIPLCHLPSLPKEAALALVHFHLLFFPQGRPLYHFNSSSVYSFCCRLVF